MGAQEGLREAADEYIWYARGRFVRDAWLIINLLGLAISGGVDSMALAALFTGIQQASGDSLFSKMRPGLAQVAGTVLPDLRFKAFVVDHGVREGSAIEAKAVSRVLEQRGNGCDYA